VTPSTTASSKWTASTLELEVAAPGCGGSTIYEIEKDAGEPLGIVPAADPVRQCANKCVFCFIDGNPPGARQSLHLKDDDFRLSFTYGSYVTLTNLGPERVPAAHRAAPVAAVRERARDGAGVRMRLLGVPRGGEIVEQLRELTQAGLEVHTQVVLCPGWNDGVHLERTIDDLWSSARACCR
jgi:NifB/MoaA-like Fe-S oxidoreductase